MGNAYPICLKLNGKPCLVIGGGEVASRKAQTLLEYGAKVDVITLSACEEMYLLSQKGSVDLTLRAYEDGDEAGYFLVFAATGDTNVNRRIADNCNKNNILLNAVDDPDNCDFYVPAQLNRNDVTVAISTYGKSPVLAAYLKDKIAETVTEEYGVLADLFGELRKEVNASGRSEKERKAFYRDLLAKDPLTMIQNNETQQVREMFRTCISSWLD